MTTSTLNTLARCKALALAAMLDAGGKPCWVAAGPAPRPVVSAAAPAPRHRPPGRSTPGLTPGEREKVKHCPAYLILALERALRAIERGPGPFAGESTQKTAPCPLRQARR
jgi:hypothetical protein